MLATFIATQKAIESVENIIAINYIDEWGSKYVHDFSDTLRFPSKHNVMSGILGSGYLKPQGY